MPALSAQDIRSIQQALARHGFDPGIVDGVWGRRTKNALDRFQAGRGLIPDGIVGPRTRLALFGAADVDPLDAPALVWLQEARRLTGLREDPSAASNPTLLGWADKLGIAFPDDATAWCGLFIAHCIAATLPEEPLPQQPLGARNWARFGKACDPQPGAILVFWRGQRSGWQGHVGFYVGEEKDGIFHVLGGNQGDKVSVVRIKGDRLLSARWPATVPIAKLARSVSTTSDTKLSRDEA